MTTETFTLSRPLKTHDGEVTTLTLQEPTARAFVEYGEPFKLQSLDDVNSEKNRLIFVFDNNRAFMRFLTDMVTPKVDDLILSSISASDFQRLRAVAAPIILAGFPEKNFTEPSAS